MTVQGVGEGGEGRSRLALLFDVLPEPEDTPEHISALRAADEEEEAKRRPLPTKDDKSQVG